MKKMLLSLVILVGMSVMSFATVQEDTCVYSTSTFVTISSSAFTLIPRLNGQKNIELQNMDSTDSFIVCSTSTIKIGGQVIPGVRIVAGESRFWDDFNGELCIIVEEFKGTIDVGIFRQMLKRHPASN